jgi:hypothetical protein|tara:strand:+ start:321 stop:506 length:186 start_codon:yes stop_codon:yes gene_type:complete
MDQFRSAAVEVPLLHLAAELLSQPQRAQQRSQPRGLSLEQHQRSLVLLLQLRTGSLCRGWG